MAAKVQCLTHDNYPYAMDYIQTKLNIKPDWFEFASKQEMQAAILDFRRCQRQDTVKALTQFCSKWLCAWQRQQLYSALRTRKSKTKLNKRSVTLTNDAYRLMVEKSSLLEKSYSDALVHILSLWPASK
jgi:hypothetical protein